MTRDEHVIRAQLAMLQLQRLSRESRRCKDRDRLGAIEAEAEVILRSLEDIHEQQLLEQLAARQPRARRRWWRRRKTVRT
jgi:hypothetical protein